jgi:hypothetical protein
VLSEISPLSTVTDTRSSETPSAVEWVFQRSDPMGGASGEAFSNPFESTGMHPAGVLVRESIQNAVDERDKGADKVLVQFRFMDLTGAEKTAFAQTAQLRSVIERRQQLSLSGLEWLDRRRNPEVPLRLLFVEDFHTTGLEGRPHDSTSKFYRLLLAVGDAGKAHDSHNTGGSYGFGKGALTLNSQIKTIVAYSRYRDGSGKQHTRLFGGGYFRSHHIGKDEYNGRAWFGRNMTPGQITGQVVDPLEDDDADAIASDLGFEVREADELGTSILIVDTPLDPKAVKDAVEDWWWPKLIDGQLDVAIIAPDGSRSIPRPKLRPDLQAFVAAYDIAKGTNPNPVIKQELKKEFYRYNGVALGTCGLKVVEMPTEGEPPPAVPENRVDTVALIRSLGMVVQYYREWPSGMPALVGVFVSSDELDDTLKFSEPITHDKWDPLSRRLQKVSETHRKAVQVVLERIISTVRGFRKDASPPPPAKTQRLVALEKELAKFLLGTGPKKKEEQVSAPVHLEEMHAEPVKTNDNQLRVRATFVVKLKKDARQDATKLRLRMICKVIEDDKEGRPVDYQLDADTNYTKDPKEADAYIFSVEKDSPVKFSLLTKPYDPLWTVRVRPVIEPLPARANR